MHVLSVEGGYTVVGGEKNGASGGNYLDSVYTQYWDDPDNPTVRRLPVRLSKSKCI